MRANVAIGLSSSFMLAAAAAIVVIAGATIETLNPVRRGGLLIVLLLLHLLRFRRFVFPREFVVYTVFVGYMFLTLIWAPDAVIGTNTLLPAVDFVLILMLFSSLVTYHNLNAVLGGILFGFLIGAAVYTLTQGFPFSYPKDFSYNAIAGMYLFGLFITLIFGWSSGSKLVALPLGLVILVHIAATTSIKTNVGILLGVVGATLVHFRSSMEVLRRNVIPLIVVAAAIVYAVSSNDSVLERVQTGVDRVALGVEILSSRDDNTGAGTSFSDRKYWKNEGIKGWLANPLFGHGVEAFRADYGVTSHSTPIDVLYNAGVIGLALFYAMFLCLAQRLFRARGKSLVNLRALLFATFVCYLFITLSSALHSDGFLAVFVASSTALLRRCREANWPIQLQARAVYGQGVLGVPREIHRS